MKENVSNEEFMNQVNFKIKAIINQIFLSIKDLWAPRMNILAVITGMIAGLATVGFQEMIILMKWMFWGASSSATFLDAVTSMPWYYRIIIPTFGGLVVGFFVNYVEEETRGYGVTEVLNAFALKQGKIKFSVAPLKALVSAICIGSGGSAGRVGPIVQVGASLGSSIGYYLHLSPEEVKTLLLAGVAACVAVTFNAPLAGVIFSIEVIQRKTKFKSFSNILIASVAGTIIINMIFNRAESFFLIPHFHFVGYWELIFYIGLGIFTAVIALIFSNLLYFSENAFCNLRLSNLFKPALGGLMLGSLALALPQVHSTGYLVIEAVLHNQLAIGLLFALMCGKILATSLTLGSGGSGGIFAPGLFIGAMAGSLYGSIIGMIFPNIVSGASSYGIIGMGAVLAGVAHAPLSAIMIVLETTKDQKVILPLMFACIVSYLITSSIQKKSFFLMVLLRRGVDIEKARKNAL